MPGNKKIRHEPERYTRHFAITRRNKIKRMRKQLAKSNTKKGKEYWQNQIDLKQENI